MSAIDDLLPAQVVAVFSAGLGEPPEVPPACSSVLVSCLSSMLDPELSILYSASQKKMVYAQAMRFLTAPRSAEDIATLYRAMESHSCRCSQGPAILRTLAKREHGQAEGHSDDDSTQHSADLPDLVYSMTQMLSEELEKCRYLRSARIIRGDQSWPKSVDELLPGGVLAAIPQLAYWNHVIVDGFLDVDVVVSFMSPIFDLIGPPAIVAWMRTPMLWKLIQHIIAACNDEDGTGKLGAHCIPDMIGVSRLLEHVLDQLFPEEITIALREHPTFTAKEIMDMILQGLLLLSKLIYDNPAVYIRLKADWESALSRLALHLPPPPMEDVDMYAAKKLSQAIGSKTTPGYKLYRLCFGRVWEYRCYGPSCITTRSTPATHFQQCGGCHTARYCSRACQKRAWSHPGAAHRDMCAFYTDARKIRTTLNCSLDDEARFMDGLLRHLAEETVSAACGNMKAVISTQVTVIGTRLCCSLCLTSITDY
jgi:hypothetical protein